MCKIEDTLFKLGIPTYRMPIYVPFGTSPELTIQLPKELPSQIGWIYGLSTLTDNVTPDNQPVISFAQAVNLFLYLKSGQSTFIEAIRIDELMFLSATGVNWRYYPVNIPSSISLDQSYIQNPTGIVAVTKLFLTLNLHYIDLKTYNYLVQTGKLLQNGQLVDGK